MHNTYAHMNLIHESRPLLPFYIYICIYVYTYIYKYVNMYIRIHIQTKTYVDIDLSYETRVCCSVLQCVAVCCSVLQCVAVCCSVLQCVACRYRSIIRNATLFAMLHTCVYNRTHICIYIYVLMYKHIHTHIYTYVLIDPIHKLRPLLPFECSDVVIQIFSHITHMDEFCQTHKHTVPHT